MKLSKVIFSIVAVAGLVACSSDEDGIQSTDTQVNALYSDVEIRFGSGNKTRASIDNSTQDVAVNGLGIFMLAKSLQGTNPDEQGITWIRTGGNLWGAPLDEDNASADVVFSAGGTSANSITWTDGNPRYYPAGNWYNYGFYGYYPRVTGSDLISTATQRKAHYDNLDGTLDILWGKTDCSEQYAYSARYFRVPGNADKYPTIAFKHVMMSLQFAIQGLPDPNVVDQYATANRMQVKSIVVRGVPSSANLIVADYNNPAKEGTLECNWQTGTTNLEVMKKTSEGPWQINNDNVLKIGEPVMMPVIDDNAKAQGVGKFQVEIILVDNANPSYEYVVEKPLDLRVAGGSSEYTAGTRYQVTIQIAGAREITLEATLTPWVDDDSSFLPLELN